MNESKSKPRKRRTKDGEMKEWEQATQSDTTAINECLKKGRKKSCLAVKHFTDERCFLHYSSKMFFSIPAKRSKDDQKMLQ